MNGLSILIFCTMVSTPGPLEMIVMVKPLSPCPICSLLFNSLHQEYRTPEEAVIRKIGSHDPGNVQSDVGRSKITSCAVCDSKVVKFNGASCRE